jgi:hypothetical protein
MILRGASEICEAEKQCPHNIRGGYLLNNFALYVALLLLLSSLLLESAIILILLRQAFLSSISLRIFLSLAANPFTLPFTLQQLS